MENEYIFNYDEVKRRFESVPSTNSSMAKKFKSTTYKTFFQPRTKSVSNKGETRPNLHSFVRNHIQQQETNNNQIPKVTLQMHVVCVQQVVHVDELCLQTQQGFYLPALIQ